MARDGTSWWLALRRWLQRCDEVTTTPSTLLEGEAFGAILAVKQLRDSSRLCLRPASSSPLAQSAENKSLRQRKSLLKVQSIHSLLHKSYASKRLPRLSGCIMKPLDNSAKGPTRERLGISPVAICFLCNYRAFFAYPRSRCPFQTFMFIILDLSLSSPHSSLCSHFFRLITSHVRLSFM